MQEQIMNTEQLVSTVSAEKDKKVETSKKIWDMSEAVYKDKKKVEELNLDLATERNVLQKEKEKFQAKNKRLWDQSVAIHKEKTKIALLHQDIKDSILYAKNIQQAMLPTHKYIRTLLPNSFILFKPRDEVSGDFYWFTEKDDLIYFIAADCTGHGVPGALMSMICITFLNEAVNQRGIVNPNEILFDVRKNIIASLKQSEQGQKDGMDAILCCWDKKNRTLSFAAAHNPFILIRKGELIETKPDKLPVGYLTEEQKPFTHHSIQLEEDDSIFIFTDGYADQFGGPKNKKYMMRRFRELLLSINDQDVYEQKKKLDETSTIF